VDITEPRGLELVREFVNTNDIEGKRDVLQTPERLAAWLSERNLIPAGTAVDAGSHARALELREGIRALARANNDEPLDEGRVAAMNRAARAAPMTLAVEPQRGDAGWRLDPAAGGVDAFLGQVMGAIASSMATGTFDRLKACRNDTCRWLFYDHSRNRSATWCTMAVCGSRMKARAYRARQREAART
jgi:predicted RNA-binding Zn ribbon-like protein